ncbi:MAG: RodZ domain-containing protein [Pseudomonadota bacterium]|nr:RodZ domain-containing protein [Pseudomonadota bacterium]
MRASAQPQQHPRLVSDSERPGAGVGAILRGARLARDEELREVASALRIRLPYLEAIEDGRVEDLPGVTYGIGFVRAYAEYLGLDAADIVSRFKLEARGIDRRTQLHFPEPLPGNRVPGGALLLLVLIMAGAVYGGWLYTTSQNMTFTEAVEALPERFLALLEDGEPVTATATEDAAQTGSEQAAPAETETTAMAPAEGTAADPAEPALDQIPPPATAVDTAAPIQTPEPAATGEVSAPETEAADTVQVAPQAETEQAVPATTPATPSAEAEAAPVPEQATPQTAEPVTAAAPQPVTDQPAEPASEPAADPTGGAAADTEISPPSPAPAPAPVESAQPRPEPAPQPAAPAPVQTATVETQPQPEPAAPPSIVTEELAAPALPAEEETAAVPQSDTATASTGDAAATASAASGPRIIIQATNESWIQVVDANGAVLIEKLMLMGEIYRVPNRDGLKLNTGNAGALKLIVNGTLIPPLSTQPEVMRNIDLSPQALTQ